MRPSGCLLCPSSSLYVCSNTCVCRYVFPFIYPWLCCCCRCLVLLGCSFIKTSCEGKTKGRMLHFSAAKNGSIVSSQYHIHRAFLTLFILKWTLKFKFTMLGNNCCAHFHDMTCFYDGNTNSPTYHWQYMNFLSYGLFELMYHVCIGVKMPHSIKEMLLIRYKQHTWMWCSVREEHLFGT